MDVVHERVADAGRGQRGGKLRLPNALGEPRTGRTTAEVLFQVVGEARDLFALVRGGMEMRIGS